MKGQEQWQEEVIVSCSMRKEMTDGVLNLGRKLLMRRKGVHGELWGSENILSWMISGYSE